MESENENLKFTDTPAPEPEVDAYGKVKGAKTDKGADIYAGLSNAHMSFDGIGCLEACNGDVVLRGRNGQRDIIFPLNKAVQKYFDWMAMVHSYALHAVSGWDQMMDIAQDFKAKICEAVAQRKKEGLEVPPEAEKFVASQVKPRL